MWRERVNPLITDRIQTELTRIEAEHGVSIFYACESGSRAWGFESQDSDYDVRFLYLHRTEWYLTIADKRDVIEVPIDDELDISGWGIRKALALLRKSNPPFLEWMQSPVVYKDNPAVSDLIRAAMPAYYSPKSCLYHYLHMAQGNFREYLKNDEVWVKKYLYVLRPVLACLWIEADRGLVPTEFGKLVDGIVHDSVLRQDIQALLERKRQGKEIDRGPKIPSISAFIEEQLERLTGDHARPAATRDPAQLDVVFRKALVETWGDRIELTRD
jgi:uncharacterized protein